MFKGKNILITGGTGTLGNALVERLLSYKPNKIIIFSRDEKKQYDMRQKFTNYCMRYVLGDVRDIDGLKHSLYEVDYVIHTAALKQVDTLEYNPVQAVHTNILGAVNVVNACNYNNVSKVVALSTDKSVNPINMYGASKLCSDKLFINGNALSGGTTKYAVVRYGNVAGSRGSVIPYYEHIIKNSLYDMKATLTGIKRYLPVTDERMTRFNITIDQGVDLIFKAFEEMQGGEIFVAKIPSYKITDLVKSFGCTPKIIGIRPGEKLSEIMITQEDNDRTYDCGKYYVIHPQFDWITKRKYKGKLVDKGFSYSSDNNKEWCYK